MMDLRDNIYAVKEPYPPIKVEKKSQKYVNILLQNYSGMVSEFTAVNQYVYHKFRLSMDYPKVAETINGIAIVEMHHLEILGKLIVLLGGDPRYWISKNDKKYYWNAKFVDYGNTIKEFLSYDIQAEITAIRDYKKAKSEISDPNIIKIIDRILLDEEYHLELFKNLYDEYIK